MQFEIISTRMDYPKELHYHVNKLLLACGSPRTKSNTQLQSP